jgi:hypothetical protein
VIRALVAAAALARALVVAVPSSAAGGPDPYPAAVQRAAALVEQARQGNPTAARQALSVLRARTGDSQPEILADLDKDPPDLDAAAARLRALSAALEAPADTADPNGAHSRLDAIIAESRYDSLRAASNPLDRLVNWILDHLAQFLAGASLPTIPGLEQGLLLLGVLLVGGIAAWLLIGLRGRAGGDTAVGRPFDPRRAAVDHLAEADRLAAAGDFTAAVRELAAAVAERLGGEEAWDASPLTVRELFGHAAHPELLRPLLLGFERAAYAGRPADRQAYEAAAGAVRLFMRPQEAAA